MILPPFTPYTLTVRKRQREVWMIFDARPHLQQVLSAPSGAFQTIPVFFQDPRQWAGVQFGLRELLHWRGSHPTDPQLAENAMERILLLACRAHGQHESVADDRITRAVIHLKDHLHQELSIECLARVAGLSSSRFAHVFLDRTGVTPMKFLELQRIEKARHLLLTTDHPVQLVALDCGYPNAQHFSIRFRRHTGQSPRDFRRHPISRQVDLNPQQDAK